MKALELDPDLPEAHAALGGFLHYYEHKWKMAEDEYKRAIALKPSYATAHQWYSHVLAQQGNISEAMKEIRKALELDPFSPIINENYGNGLYFNKEYERAIEQGKKVLEMDPSRDVAYSSLVQAYNVLKMFDEGLEHVDAYEKAMGKSLETKLQRAFVFAFMSRNTEARDLLAEIEAGYQKENVSPFWIAGVNVLLGEIDTAFEWLEKAFNSHDGNINLLLVEREFDGIRQDPRYFDLLKRIGLSPG